MELRGIKETKVRVCVWNCVFSVTEWLITRGIQATACVLPACLPLISPCHHTGGVTGSPHNVTACCERSGQCCPRLEVGVNSVVSGIGSWSATKTLESVDRLTLNRQPRLDRSRLTDRSASRLASSTGRSRQLYTLSINLSASSSSSSSQCSCNWHSQ